MIILEILYVGKDRYCCFADMLWDFDHQSAAKEYVPQGRS